MIKTWSENEEVLYISEGISLITQFDLQELKRLALINPRHRVRLCTHRSPDDRLHEMFIVHAKDCYVRPHKHIQKTESMSILEGEVDVILFNEDGEICQVNQLGAPETGKIFYQKLPEETFHMLIIRTELLVFHEITLGPFLKENTIFPEWAPIDYGADSLEFFNKINLKIKKEIEEI